MTSNPASTGPAQQQMQPQGGRGAPQAFNQGPPTAMGGRGPGAAPGRGGGPPPGAAPPQQPAAAQAAQNQAAAAGTAAPKSEVEKRRNEVFNRAVFEDGVAAIVTEELNVLHVAAGATEGALRPPPAPHALPTALELLMSAVAADFIDELAEGALAIARQRSAGEPAGPPAAPAAAAPAAQSQPQPRAIRAEDVLACLDRAYPGMALAGASGAIAAGAGPGVGAAVGTSVERYVARQLAVRRSFHVYESERERRGKPGKAAAGGGGAGGGKKRPREDAAAS